MGRGRKTANVFWNILLVVVLFFVWPQSRAEAVTFKTVSVSNMKISTEYASGPYYPKLIEAMKASVGTEKTAADRLVNIALSQVGYTSGNLQGTGTGGNIGGLNEFLNHTKYFYTDQKSYKITGAWCASYVSWCLDAAGFSEAVAPRWAQCGKFRSFGKTNGTIHWIYTNEGENAKLTDTYQPKKGDLVLFGPSDQYDKKTNPQGCGGYYNGHNSSCHIGIVISDGKKASNGGWNFEFVDRDGEVVRAHRFANNRQANTREKRSKGNSCHCSRIGCTANNNAYTFQAFVTPVWSKTSAWTVMPTDNLELVTPKIALPRSTYGRGENIVIDWAKTENASILEGYWIRILGANNDVKVNEWAPKGASTYTYAIPSNVATGTYTIEVTAVAKDTVTYPKKADTVQVKVMENRQDAIVVPTIQFDKADYMEGEKMTFTWEKSPDESALQSYRVQVRDPSTHYVLDTTVSPNVNRYSYTFPAGAMGSWAVIITAQPKDTKAFEAQQSKLYTVVYKKGLEFDKTEYFAGDTISISWDKLDPGGTLYNPKYLGEYAYSYRVSVYCGDKKLANEYFYSDTTNYCFHIPESSVDSQFDPVEYRVIFSWMLMEGANSFDVKSMQRSFTIKPSRVFVQGASASVFDNGDLEYDFYIGKLKDTGEKATISVTSDHYTRQGDLNAVGVPVMGDSPVKCAQEGYDLYKITVPLAASQMNDEIELTLSYGENHSVDLHFNMADYIIECLAESEESKESVSPSLVKSLLNYGAAAQKYFGYKTESLANSMLSPEEQRVEILGMDEFAGYVPDDFSGDAKLLSGLSYIGMSIVLEHAITAKHYFALEQGADISDYSFFEKENTGKVIQVEKVGDSGLYCVQLQGITLMNITKSPVLCVKRGSEELAIQSGVKDYLYKAINEKAEDSGLIELLSSLYVIGKELDGNTAS